MSARAPQFTQVNLLVVAFLVGVLLTITCTNQARAQGPIAANQLAELVTRVRASSPEGVAGLHAIAVARKLLAEQRYKDADELFSALLEKLPREPVLLYGAALAKFNLEREARPSHLSVLQPKYFSVESDESAAKYLPLEKRGPLADALVLVALI